MHHNTTTPGFPCPQCSHRLIFSLTELISGEPLHCPQCDLEIAVNREDSRETLAELHELHQQIKKQKEQLRAASSGSIFPVSYIGEC